VNEVYEESQNQGIRFERFVENVYSNLGCRSVKHNDLYSRKVGSGKKNFQIDLTYTPRFGLRKRFVECKYTSAPAYSDFKEVAYFLTKLRFLGISSKKADFVCNKPFSDDIVLLAKQEGLTLVDEEQLLNLWKKGKRRFGFLPSLRLKTPALERLITQTA
jgi:hypothetical protein